MKTGKLKRERNFTTVLLLFVLCAISLFANAQTPRKFLRHDIVEVGNGQKAEIIQCRGEGPLEECDVIYYTTNRGQGTRMWQNANRLRDDERAAQLLKDIRQGKVNSLARTPVNGKKISGEEDALAQDNGAKSGSQISKLTGSRGFKLLDSATIGKGTEMDKDLALHKVIRRIDSVTKAKVDTFKLALQREIEIQDSIANGEKTEVKQVNEPADTSASANAVIPNLDLEKAAPAIPATEPQSKPQTQPQTANSLVKPAEEPVQKETQRMDTAVSVNNEPDIIKEPTQGVQTSVKAEAETILPAKPVEPKRTDENVSANVAKPPADSALNVAGAGEKNSSEKEPDNVNTTVTGKPATPQTTAEKGKELAETKTTPETAVKPLEEYTTTAEVSVNGDWQKVTIVAKESEYLYKVHYDGKSDSEDEWVASSQIRNMDSVRIVSPVKELKAAGPNNNNSANCSFAAPAPPVSDADKFSVKLAKRKIYEGYLEEAKNKNTKAGVTFLSFQTGEPFVNMVSVSATHTLVYKYASAPAGAMIYPVKTKYTLCEQASGKTESKTVSSNYSCFRNKEGMWTCKNDK